MNWLVETNNTIHFVGIGGSGMSAIASVLLQQGYRVTGSDAQDSIVTRRLAAMGARVFLGHREEHLGTDVAIVVRSTAIKNHNPEIEAAQRRELPVLHRGQMLARLMQQRRGIAIAGAHGKTTTSAMASGALLYNGLDPTILVGGDVIGLGSNARWGQGDWLVAEADESDGSFLWLNPEIVLITNIEDDHLDHYGSLAKIQEAFVRFIERVPADGVKILCSDDPILAMIARQQQSGVLTYGATGSPDFQIRGIQPIDGGTRSAVWRGEQYLGNLELKVPGVHNALNALGCVALGSALGISFEQSAAALAEFRGVRRRFELVGLVDEVQIVDDYAHHPTEIRATLEAARQVGAGRIIAVFQPHRYTRTRNLAEQFGQAFDLADVVVLDQIYPAGEEPIPGVSTQLIVDALQHNGYLGEIHYPQSGGLTTSLEQLIQPGDLVLTLGAGNINRVGQELVNRLSRAAG